MAVLADKGYHNGEQLAACELKDIYTIVAYRKFPCSHPVPTPEYYGSGSAIQPQKDQYKCPQGHILKTTGQWYNKSMKSR